MNERGVKPVRPLVDALLPWFARNARDLPWRRTRDPYAIWISEVMLQQTQVKTVIPYWERWMRTLPDAAMLAGADDELIHKLWEGLGYYSRARNLRAAAREIMTNHHGKFPADHAAVLELPGIGPYTAGAVCSIAFNQPQPILDGNVTRVLARVFGIAGSTRLAATRKRLWALAGEIVQAAPGNAGAINQALMELGAIVCAPAEPRCGECPAGRFCHARRRQRVHLLPNLGKRPPTTPRKFFAFMVVRGDRFLIRRRPDGGVNAGLWEFPNQEVPLTETAPGPVASALFGSSTCEPEPWLVIRHSITRYRMTLCVFRARAATGARVAGTWATARELGRLAFSGAHRRIANAAGR